MRRLIPVILFCAGIFCLACAVDTVRPVKAQFDNCGSGFCAQGVRPASGPWTPNSDPGVLLWLEADSGTFTSNGCTGAATNGQTIGCWADKSANANNVTNTNTSSQFPTFNTNQLNSLPTITYTRALSTCLFTTIAQVSLGGTALSGFALLKTTTNTLGSDRFVSFQANSQTADWNNTPSGVMAMANSGNTTVAAIRNGSLLSGGTISASTYTQVGSIYDGTNNTFYIAGSAQSSSASSGSFGVTGQLAIGCFTQGGTGIGNPADMVIAAAYVTKSTNTASNIETYWFNKWAVH